MECYLDTVLNNFYTRLTVGGVGNCLFYCLRLAIPKLSRLPIKNVRDLICDELKTTIKKLLSVEGITSESFNDYHRTYPVFNEISINRYIDYMRKNATYGTSTEILAAQIKFGKNICIYTMEGDLETGYESLKQLVLPKDAYERECDIILYHCSNERTDPRNHFELLIPKIKPMPTKDTIRKAVSDFRSHETAITLLAEDIHKQDEQRRLEEEDKRLAHELLAEDIHTQDEQRHLEEEHKRLVRDLVNQEKNPQADPHNKATQSLIRELIRDRKTDEEIKQLMNWTYKYLKYKTKYLTLKKNTNLLYK